MITFKLFKWFVSLAWKNKFEFYKKAHYFNDFQHKVKLGIVDFTGKIVPGSGGTSVVTSTETILEMAAGPVRVFVCKPPKNLKSYSKATIGKGNMLGSI